MKNDDIVKYLKQAKQYIFFLDDDWNFVWANTDYKNIEPFLDFKFDDMQYINSTWYFISVNWLDNTEGFLTIVTDVTHVKRDYNQLLITNRLDNMTKAYNKFEIDAIIKFYMHQKHLEDPYGTILLEIDFFKEFKKARGKDFTNHVLRDMVSLIKEHLEEFDFIIRNDDAEFLIFKKYDNYDQFEEFANKLHKQLTTHVFIYQLKETTISCSFGISNLIPGEKYMHSIDRASHALFLSKNNGFNQVSSVHKKYQERVM